MADSSPLISPSLEASDEQHVETPVVLGEAFWRMPKNSYAFPTKHKTPVVTNPTTTSLQARLAPLDSRQDHQHHELAAITTRLS